MTKSNITQRLDMYARQYYAPKKSSLITTNGTTSTGYNEAAATYGSNGVGSATPGGGGRSVIGDRKLSMEHAGGVPYVGGDSEYEKRRWLSRGGGNRSETPVVWDLKILEDAARNNAEDVLDVRPQGNEAVQHVVERPGAPTPLQAKRGLGIYEWEDEEQHAATSTTNGRFLLGSHPGSCGKPNASATRPTSANANARAGARPRNPGQSLSIPRGGSVCAGVCLNTTGATNAQEMGGDKEEKQLEARPATTSEARMDAHEDSKSSAPSPESFQGEEDAIGDHVSRPRSPTPQAMLAWGADGEMMGDDAIPEGGDALIGCLISACQALEMNRAIAYFDKLKGMSNIPLYEGVYTF